MRLQRVLAGDKASVGEARRVASKWINALGGRVPVHPAVKDDVELVVSELVTNSVRAGATSIELQLDLHDSVVAVKVTDNGSGWPTPRRAGITDVTGRGLKIVAAIAETWGATRDADGRTGVWASVRL